MNTQDIHSLAIPEEAVVTHLDLNLVIDFDSKKITGSAKWDIQNKSGSDKVIFDTRGLNIDHVTLDASAENAKFQMGDSVPFLGRALTVSIKPETKSVTIFYSTNPDAAALQWLGPEQTEGKKFPFLFTQSQAILARTWVPCQDSPGIRFTYSASVKVPKGMMALMSAENPQQKDPEGEYKFKMSKPIPSYLMALAAGDVEFTPIGKRTGIYAEHLSIAKSAYEFADMEKMLESAEKLYGNYQWGRYDMIILPPSFPFGGMENPCLTFCTPTIIAGDRSLTSLVAHELAHSWSGNLVTNATWNDFWMNEGFTVYFENRIMEALYGKPFAEMQEALGVDELKMTVKEIGDTNADTHLKLNLKGRDPDDGMNDIAYEKGNLLLKLIEDKVGREKWDAFLKSYFQRHAFRTITTEQFISEYKSELIKNDSALAASIDLEKWVYGPGIPSNAPTITSEKFVHTDKQSSLWTAGTKASALETKGFTTYEWMRFLRALPSVISSERMKELDDAFHFTKSGNSEILAAWFEHVIQSQYSPAYPALEHFLIYSAGRRKFSKPLYGMLVATPEGLTMAKKIFAVAGPNYHSITRETIMGIIAEAEKKN